MEPIKVYISNGDPKGHIFNPILTQLMDSFLILKIKHFFYKKKIPNDSQYPGVRQNMSLKTKWLLVYRHAADNFISFPPVGTGYVQNRILIWVKQQKSKRVGNTSITYCTPTHGTARKSAWTPTDTTHQEDSQSKSTRPLFSIKAIAKLDRHKARKRQRSVIYITKYHIWARTL